MRKISVLLLLAMAGCAVPVRSYQEFIRDTFSPDRYQYPVVVNYNVAVDSLVKDGIDGNYILLNPDINSQNFSLTMTGAKKVKVLLAHFDKQPMTHSEILKALYKQHLRPVNTQEFLCFVQKYCWNLRELANHLDSAEVICLGSMYKPSGSFYSMVLRWHLTNEMDQLERIPSGLSIVDFAFLELNWLSDSYFAVVSTDSVEEDAEIKPKH